MVESALRELPISERIIIIVDAGRPSRQAPLAMSLLSWAQMQSATYRAHGRDRIIASVVVIGATLGIGAHRSNGCDAAPSRRRRCQGIWRHRRRRHRRPTTQP